MQIDAQLQRKLIGEVARCVIDHAEELTALDQAVGDGDHGINMKRGFEAVLGDLDKTSALPMPEALKAVGMALVMKVGGASGPLYGTLFIALGKAFPESPTRAALAEAFSAAVEAVKTRGKSDVRMKTMLDVLVPVLETLRRSGGDVYTELRATAQAAAAATVPMQAVRGRASFLGARSVGHMDPGARSSWLMVETVADVLEGKQPMTSTDKNQVISR
ncbi:MAG TPA: dihydroxyacetone kinase subunit DhaL [Burkholderiales bacterium]|nr:dihydroxyacetone kinase subunit DhaL [Burkholderiales bacterium]